MVNSYECVRDYDPGKISGRILGRDREGGSRFINQVKDRKIDQGLQGSGVGLCLTISPPSHVDIHIPVVPAQTISVTEEIRNKLKRNHLPAVRCVTA